MSARTFFSYTFELCEAVVGQISGGFPPTWTLGPLAPGVPNSWTVGAQSGEVPAVDVQVGRSAGRWASTWSSTTPHGRRRRRNEPNEC